MSEVGEGSPENFDQKSVANTPEWMKESDLEFAASMDDKFWDIDNGEKRPESSEIRERLVDARIETMGMIADLIAKQGRGDVIDQEDLEKLFALSGRTNQVDIERFYLPDARTKYLTAQRGIHDRLPPSKLNETFTHGNRRRVKPSKNTQSQPPQEAPPTQTETPRRSGFFSRFQKSK